MRRRVVWAVLVVLAVVAAAVVVVRVRAAGHCAVELDQLPRGRTQVANPEAPEGSDWGDPDAAAMVAAARSPAAGSPVGPLLWVASEHDDVRDHLGFAPGVNDLLAIPGGLFSYDPRVIAVDPLTGREGNGVTAKADWWVGAAGISDAIVGVGASVNDDQLEAGRRTHSLLGIDLRTGDRTWCFSFESAFDEPPRLRVVPDDPDLAVMAAPGGRVTAFDPSTGQIRWSGGPVEPSEADAPGSAVRLDVGEGSVVTQASTSEPVVVRSLRTGRVTAEVAGNWALDHERDLPLARLEAVSPEQVLVTEVRPSPSAASDAPAEELLCTAELVAYDLDGEEQWRAERGTFSMLSIDCSDVLQHDLETNRARVHDDTVVFYDNGAAALRALALADGTERWRVAADREGADAAIRDGDHLFLPDPHTGLRVVDLRTGAATVALSWTYEFPQRYVAPRLTIAGPDDHKVLVIHETRTGVIAALALNPTDAEER